MATNQWTKAGEGMRRNNASRTLYANFRHKGKTYRHSLNTEDKTIARNRLVAFRQDLESGKISNAVNTTVEEIAPRFLASLSGMSPSSQTRAKGHLKQLIEEFGSTNPREIKPMNLEEWLQELREKDEFGEDCWNKYRTTLQKFFVFLIENSFASENPAMLIDYLKAKAGRKYTPTTKEVNAILHYIETRMPQEKETLAFVEFLALTGQGKAEAVHAQWIDVVYSEKKINFYRQKTRAKAHNLPLFPAVETFLERRLKGRKPSPEEPLFRIQSAKKAIAKACEKLGISHLGHHSFRRYFITQRLMEGVPPNIVAKWVGHKNSEMVMEIYSSIPNTFEVSFAHKIPAIRS